MNNLSAELLILRFSYNVNKLQNKIQKSRCGMYLHSESGFAKSEHFFKGIDPPCLLIKNTKNFPQFRLV